MSINTSGYLVCASTFGLWLWSGGWTEITPSGLPCDASGHAPSLVLAQMGAGVVALGGFHTDAGWAQWARSLEVSYASWSALASDGNAGWNGVAPDYALACSLMDFRYLGIVIELDE